MLVTQTSAKRPEVSVIIPARNEEVSLGTCLESLVSQSGVEFEIIVVNDHSTDRTGEIAASLPGVRVIEAGPLPQGWTGKNNSVACGAREAHGEWLLFTDADTMHLPGSLARALAEAKEQKAEMLSYSPDQIAITFWEMAVLPVVFAELAQQYSPSKVSDPASPIAAANGQFILIRRETYDAIGGHAAVAGDILEDVALARRVKAAGRKLRFRYAADAVRTRMYRSFAQLREGWTKNLALLFPRPGLLAVKLLLLWICPWTVLTFHLAGVLPQWWWNPVFVGGFTYLVLRTNRANFTTHMNILASFFGMPMFAYLLLRSKRMHANGIIAWKGRTYGSTQDNSNEALPNQNHKMIMKTPLILILLMPLAIAASHFPLHAQIAEDPRFTNTMIEPGHSLGPLKLGDSLDRAREFFPKKDIDQEWDDACGSTIDWTDSNNPEGHGEVFIRVKKGKVFQIESSTSRFHTAEDISTFDSPEKVEKSYKDMHAWVLLTAPSPALGSRPPVFWIDKKKGIAFELAYDAQHHKRYVYKVIVFEPNKTFCPEQETVNSLKWQPIDSYAMEPPKDLSPDLPRN
jgi:glycosyltransferase involved in cell wall biosynthesis